MKKDNMISNDVYKELYFVLCTNEELLQKVPPIIIDFVKRMASKSTNKYDFSSLDDAMNHISRQALAIYILFYLKYGNATSIEKERIKGLLINNSIHNYSSREKFLNNMEENVYTDLANDDLIINKVRVEAENSITDYSKDQIGYDDAVYFEMKKRLEEMGINCDPFLPEDIQ